MCIYFMTPFLSIIEIDVYYSDFFYQKKIIHSLIEFSHERDIASKYFFSTLSDCIVSISLFCFKAIAVAYHVQARLIKKPRHTTPTIRH